MESAIQCQFVAPFTKQGSTHNTKEGNDLRSIQNVRVSRFGNTKKSPQMYLSSKCPSDLVSSYLLNYFIRNHTTHTYVTKQRDDIYLLNPKLTLGKNTLRFSGAALFNDLPTLVKEATLLLHF